MLGGAGLSQLLAVEGESEGCVILAQAEGAFISPMVTPVQPGQALRRKFETLRASCRFQLSFLHAQLGSVRPEP